MIPLVHDEVVEKKHWMQEEEFLNMLALAQSAPGVMAVNTAIFIGYQLRGLRGVLVTVLGSVLPSFLIILLIATVFTRFREYPQVEAVFKGIRPVVVSLIAVPTVKMARKGNKTWWAWLITALTLVLVAFMNVSPIMLLFILIVIALCFTLWKERRSGNG